MGKASPSSCSPDLQICMAANEVGEGERTEGRYPDDRKIHQYSNLFFLLQSEPRHIAALCRLVRLSEIDTLLHTVMFALYGNQYESREEHLLLTMFQSVLSAQFETTTEFSSLLRANDPISRMFTTYTRRGPGQNYLKSVLAERIKSLIEHKDLNLEINPVKVYEQLVAAENPDVQAFIAPRIESVPYGIRWICKQIRALTRRKYPEATDDAICSLIGGFFFLRFIMPAIVTPQVYMLVEGVPAKNPRRTLTLIAKMLQNLANKPSYAKEAFMIALNPFVENNKARMNQFLNNLCEVEDFDGTLEMGQLSKKALMIHISLNELYNTHSLILQHIETLSPNDKEQLRILAEELGPAPAQSLVVGYIKHLEDSALLYMEPKSSVAHCAGARPRISKMLKVIPPATYHWSVDPYFGHSVKIPVGILQRVGTGFVALYEENPGLQRDPERANALFDLDRAE
ncbi:Rho GTPase activation protein [Mycena leptocephala]|nr:Rho GTPase activation protein [Mycena leptocephala]